MHNAARFKPIPFNARMIHKMPRSLTFNNRWRIILIALAVLAPLCLMVWRADAQRNRPARGNADPAQQGQQRKNITPLRASETPEGSRIMITSDGALNDYSAYRSGERFYVLIPAADAPRALSGLRGRGFDDVRVQKRGNDVLLSFRLLSGAAARVSQKFNRLEILITVPSLVAANNAANANVRPQPTPQVANTNTRITNTNTRTQTGTGNANSAFPQANINSVNPNQIDPTQVNPQGTGTTRRNTGTATTNPSFTNPQTGITDESATQSGTDFPPVAQTSPTPFPSITPPSDQLAQVQPTPGIPATTTGGPVTSTNAPAPASGTSLGAQLKQNWLFVALGLLIVGLIAWVLIARSRADSSPVERRVEKLRETKTERIVEAAPAKAARPKVTKAKATTEMPAAEIPKAIITPVIAPVVTPPPPPVEVEAEPVVAGSSSAVIAPVEEPVEEVAAAPVAEVVEEAKGIEPVSVPVEVEQASDEVANLLAGHGYDENVVSTHDVGARQIITAELVAALTGRNPARHERAREAFIKHGYFDDATRTLRTAESPAERASAARSLGLVRDQSATPHLVAALEDTAPEVRRAAVESLAEVRDSAAVAPLEALRDREKDRRVPNTLIQHAIEASVVGRAKAEPTAPVHTPYATTPLTEEPVQATTPLSAETNASIAEETPAQVVEAETHAPVEEPVAVEEAAVEEVAAEEMTAPPVEAAAPEAVEEAPVVVAEEVAVKEEVEEAAQPLPFSTEPVAGTAEPSQPVSFVAEPVAETTLETEAVAAPPAIEEPVEVEEAEPSLLAETEVVAEEAAVVAEPEAATTEAETVAPVPEEVPAPVATAEPVIEYNDGSASEWVDVDMSASETAAPPPVMPVAPVEEAALADAAPETSATTETPATLVAEATEAVTEELPETAFPPALPVIAPVVSERGVEPVNTSETGIDVASASKEIDVAEEDLSAVPSAVLRRLASEDAAERATAVSDLGRIGGEDSFREISASFDDPSTEVRNAAARALFNLNPDRAASFTRALREAPPERRRHIGAALASSGLATEAIGHLMGESREKTYDAFSLLFLMSKAGEVQPLMRAVEEHPNNEVRLAVVKLLALSGQQEILPAFRRLAVRGSLPTEVRSAVMEAIYQISSQTPDTASRS